jgi:large subunit ribosomal protein L23
MAILDTFRKKKKEDKPVKEAEIKIVPEKKSKAEEKIEKPKTGKKIIKKEFSQLAAKILKSPHITEKAINLGRENKYVFKVSQKANKSEIKKAVQELYGVGVERVNIINASEKKRRVGRFEGLKSGYKKAIVQVREGDKIEAGI